MSGPLNGSFIHRFSSVVPSFPLLLQCRMTDGAPEATRDGDRLYADIVVPRHLEGPFTYLVPRAFQAEIRLGQLVMVPFGRSQLQGAVVSLSTRPPSDFDSSRLKTISRLLSDDRSVVPENTLFGLARWVSEHYAAPFGQTLRLVLPPSPPTSTPLRRLQLTPQGENALHREGTCSEAARSILERLKAHPSGLPQSAVAAARSRVRSIALQWLLNQRWVAQVESPRRGPAARGSIHGVASGTAETEPQLDLDVIELNEGREFVRSQLSQSLRQNAATRVLIQAPWPERLARLRQAVRETLNMGKQVLVVTGEGERAEEIAGRLRADNPSVLTVCVHSGMQDSVRAEQWQRIEQQQVRIVVGTRSAVFLPLLGIGLVWVEGEEHSALKEPKEPRYHAREVAWHRAQSDRAVLVVSSAHPSIETLAAVQSSGRVFRFPVSDNQAPTVSLVDLRGQGRESSLTPPLVQALREAMAQHAGAILFLNRKFYAGALVCQECGQIPRCPACSVALTYSRQHKRLGCGYCGWNTAAFEMCQSCSSPRLHPVGEGTERVEQDARRLFPQATILRLDGETLRRPQQFRALWGRVAARDWDVLVGTQVLFRPLLEQSVAFVGVVQADTGLSLPDFRAAERTYHQLQDAVGLARPAGQVIIQTYLPTHHAMRAIIERDESVFLSEERAQRAALGYPPFVHLIALHISGVDRGVVTQAAASWATLLNSVARQGEGTITVLGPVPAPLARLKGRYRIQILLKSLDWMEGIRVARDTIRQMEQTVGRRAVKFDVDVDPIEMF